MSPRAEEQFNHFPLFEGTPTILGGEFKEWASCDIVV